MPEAPCESTGQFWRRSCQANPRMRRSRMTWLTAFVRPLTRQCDTRVRRRTMENGSQYELAFGRQPLCLALDSMYATQTIRGAAAGHPKRPWRPR
jgi:hypothetical protein